MKIKKELIKRSIAGDSFLVPVGKTIYDSNGLFLLTEVGAFIWDLLPNVEDEAQILSAVLAEYDVDEATARADIAAFLAKLHDMEIL
ncbi:MAG: PqqD family protein [Ruminococcaceae bacterium]|nr:PqqD family protein [Oscillospiraceae bacterium]MBQ3215617.1 PqqD family protein [Oscillospiraceae bacterium]